VVGVLAALACNPAPAPSPSAGPASAASAASPASAVGSGAASAGPSSAVAGGSAAPSAPATGSRPPRPRSDAPLAAAEALRVGPPAGVPTGAPASGAAGPTYTLSQRPPEAMLTAPDPVDACADCHPDETDHYAQTGMGRALFLPNQHPPIEDFRPEKATVLHPVTKAVYRAYIDAEGRWWQEESFPGRPGARRLEVLWVVGSGNNTRSYLGLFEGEVVELPLTWYSRRRLWDMSPGYEGKNHFRFARTVKPECIFCHNDLTPIVDGTLSGYVLPLALGITCNRCHGDGRKHAEERLAGKGPPEGAPDPSVLNPKRLPPARQLDLCEQCHLQGDGRQLLAGQRWDAYDPSVPLADYLSIYTKPGPRGEAFGIASHGDRMLQSPCSKQSAGRLTCTTCHNPHKPATPASMRAACLGCHTTAQCGDAHAKSPDAECWKCHMRKGGTSDIPHVTFTDHWIRKRPEKGPGSKLATPPATAEFVDALAPRRTVPDTQAALREGLAHHDYWRHQGDASHLPLASELLESATPRVKDRADAWFALARVRVAQRNPSGAAEAFAEATRLDPRNAVYMVDEAQNLEDMGNLQGAEAVLRRTVAVRPGYRVAWGNLANNLVRQQRMDDANAAFDMAEKLTPSDAMTPQNRGFAALAQRRFDAAIELLAEAARRDPLSAQPLFGQGMALVAQGKLNEARPPLDAALTLDPNFGPARWLRGQVRASQRDLPGAREDYRQWTTVESANPMAFAELAKVELALGDKAAARKAAAQAAKLAPGDPAVKALQDQLGRP
jgi:tetratricopeptide (TPR) repeat protein